MILENSTNNELNIFTGMTDSTLMIIQEFLNVIEDATTITTDIAKKEGAELSELAFNAYINNYEHFKSRVSQQDLDTFEKIVNYICTSSYKCVDLKEVIEFKSHTYESDYGQFGDNKQCSFNTKVGIEYKLCYKNEVFTGVNCTLIANRNNIYTLSSAISNLFSDSNLTNISNGLIKKRTFKNGSFIKMKFILNTTSFDEFKLNISNIMKDEFFQKWQFRGIPSKEDFLRIRYFHKLKSELFGKSRFMGDEKELKSMHPITYYCINWVINTSYFRATSSKNPSSAVLNDIRDFIVPICMDYFVPDSDKELFYKLIYYVTYANNLEATLGFNGLSETNREKALCIIENLEKMRRLIGKVVYDKSIASKDINLRLNTFNPQYPLCVNNFNDVDLLVEYITNLSSFKDFSLDKINHEESLFDDNSKTEPFKEIGISEEGMYLALLAIKSLYEMSNKGIRDNARSLIIKRAKRFVDANDYEIFSEIITKFTEEEEHKFIYIPSNKMDINTHAYKSISNYFTDGKYINKRIPSGSTLYVSLKGDNRPFIKTIKSTNNLFEAYSSLNKFFLQGLISTREGKYLDSINECFISLIPSLDILSWRFEECILSGNPQLRNQKIAALVKEVLEVEDGYIAYPKDGVEYEEVSFNNSTNSVSVTENNICSQETHTTPVNNLSTEEESHIPVPTDNIAIGANSNIATDCIYNKVKPLNMLNNNIYTDTDNNTSSTTAIQPINSVEQSTNEEDVFLFSLDWLAF